ncbi:uncharacterized protein APUU_80508A [Aspergillus puulaauensis]|uniref:LYC1 C-terminal domain-containing protein n=1 Tax=Aspergillus puulaauensis TaxID=1220207 RepID=A0A7R8AUT6_9EURO|nr:uncharacterized protein APUU_80508A [Aspergillus puulaauensis]BCS30205.1 hypothetical protein APUU_80508A [Aspergillus puulaauensis]
MEYDIQLPLSSSPSLHLAHPTPTESRVICRQTAPDWKDALSHPQYLEEYAFLLTAPLARNSGVTSWILVDKTQPEDKRTILASCETFRKDALVGDCDGNCTNVIAHGIASVYCHEPFRKRGYASRLLRELADVLPRWQVDNKTSVVGSILYSDIDPGFYYNLGWTPFASDQLEFEPSPVAHNAIHLHAEDLRALCEEDEALLRASMSKPSPDKHSNPRFAIVPNHEHVLWHHAKEEFGSQRLFGSAPSIKGAIAGPRGNRVWATWTHRFYRHPDVDSSANTLYILRFVVESPEAAAEDVCAVLGAARAEAAEWGLGKVKLWAPERELEGLIEQSGVPFERKTRVRNSIPCLRWYDSGPVDWVLNEKYAWC